MENMTQGKISLVMIVKNEEAVLGRCLESVQGIVDEIVIADTGSTDATVEIAKKFNANVYPFTWCNDFSAARNFALSKATGDIRLILDADEYIIKGSKADILNTVNPNVVGQVLMFNIFEKDNEMNCTKNYMSRLICKGVGYKGTIHEQINSNLPRVKTNIEVEHDGYLHKNKSERNLAILFEAIKEEPEDTYLLYQLAHTLYVGERKEEAIEWYEKYYRYSKMNESYRCAALVDYLYNMISVGKLEKGIELIEKEEKHYYDSPDFNFVCAQFYRDLVLSDVQKYINYLPLIEQYYLKCLEIGETTKYDSVVGTGSYSAAYNLGVWYEVTKQFDKAKICYEMATEWGYEKAAERLAALM
nr:glycosyltransferase family 2 protein [uncultured Cellulosilyticum sp.]